MLRNLALALLFLAGSTSAHESSILAKSPTQAVTVLELYTSHGCSSCPPAERWMKGFLDRDDLWSQIVPLAFHVDYWDWIGWKDHFASSRYSDRQKDYRRSGSLRSVYTPGFVLNGREWKGWFSRQAPRIEPGSSVGRLSLRINPGDGVSASFQPNTASMPEAYVAHLAVLGFGLRSEIGAGENSGRTLSGDFVVLGMHSSEPRPSDGQLRWDLPWPALVSADTERRAVVVWVSGGKHPAPIQATGSWLP